MNLHRSLALPLAILVLLAGCSTQAAPTPTPSSAPASPSASAESSPSAQPSPSASASTVTWVPAGVPEPPLGSAITSVVPGGDGLVGIGFDGGFGSIAWTSADGTGWRDITPGGFASHGIASVIPFSGGLVGVGRGDTINVDANIAAAFLSEDGITWRPADGGAQMQGQLIDVVETDGGLFAVGGAPGADAAGIWRSADGEIWERTGGDFAAAFMWAIAEGGPGLVAVGWRRNPDPDLAVWTSSDGTDWTLAPDPEGFAGYEGTDVMDLDGTLVMVGTSFAGDEGRIWTSTHGATWTLADASVLDGGTARRLAHTPDGLVAVGGRGIDAAAWRSTDGRSWEPLGQVVPNAYFAAAHATDAGLIVSGATQEGKLETGIDVHAQVWIATLSD